MALKWIKEHISSFGGNPDSITLTGLSSGASSVHLHMLSPLSRGLFHRAVSQSGVALQPVALQKGARQKALKVAQVVGCPLNSSQEILHCLRERPFQHLVTKVPMLHGFKFVPVSIFGPVIEKSGGDGASFLEEHPFESLKKGVVTDVPWLVSSVAHEGHFPAKFFETELDQISTFWSRAVQYLLDFNYTLPANKFEKVADQLKEFYLGDASYNFTEENFPDLVRMFSHRYYSYDAETALRLHAKNAKSSVYYYQFSYPGHVEGSNASAKFVSHGQDGQYFFHKMMHSELNENDAKTTKMMMDLLINFIRTGKPSIEGVDWKPLVPAASNLEFINITSFEPAGVKKENVKELSPRTFWESLEIQENGNLFKSASESKRDEL